MKTGFTNDLKLTLNALLFTFNLCCIIFIQKLILIKIKKKTVLNIKQPFLYA